MKVPEVLYEEVRVEIEEIFDRISPWWGYKFRYVVDTKTFDKIAVGMMLLPLEVKNVRLGLLIARVEMFEFTEVFHWDTGWEHTYGNPIIDEPTVGRFVRRRFSAYRSRLFLPTEKEWEEVNEKIKIAAPVPQDDEEVYLVHLPHQRIQEAKCGLLEIIVEKGIDFRTFEIDLESRRKARKAWELIEKWRKEEGILPAT